MIRSPVAPETVGEAPPVPWELLFPKQLEVFNAHVDAAQVHPDTPTILIVDGSRESGKTLGCCNLLCRHLWETPGARAALIVKVTGSATDGGVWVDLVDEDLGIFPQWIESGLIGKNDDVAFDYTTKNKDGKPGPTSDAKTRTIYLRIRNYFGGESELRLISMQHEHEVKARLRSTRFSLIWFSELSNFMDPRVFQVSWEQLRMRHLRKCDHIWMTDTNPHEDGEESWIYRQFILREMNEMAFENVPNATEAKRQYQASIKRIHFKLEDNLMFTPTQVGIKRAHYANDPGELARMCDGEWVKGHGTQGKHFADLFVPAIHVVGEKKEQIELHESSTTLYTGWDLGSSAYHAMGIMEKRILIDPQTRSEYTVWSVIDSIFSDHEQKPIAEFGLEMLEKMNALEKKYSKAFQWKHWSDEDAVNLFRSSSGTFDYLEIQRATEGKIMLRGVPRPAKSVQARVRLLRRLLFEKRFYVSGQCAAVIDMLEKCCKGSRETDFVEWNQWKHTFDWISYVLYMECGAELIAGSRRPRTDHRAIVSYPLT